MDNHSHRRLDKIQITRSAGYITIKNGLDKYHQQYEGYLLFSDDKELCIKISFEGAGGVTKHQISSSTNLVPIASGINQCNTHFTLYNKYIQNDDLSIRK